MKISKFFSALILGLFAVLITNIFSVNALPDNFPNCSRFEIKNTDDINLTKLNHIANENNVIICAVSSKAVEIHQFSCTYYVFSDNITLFKNNYLGLKSGTIKDILGNSRILQVEDMELLNKNAELKEQINIFLAFGKKSDCRTFFENAEKQLKYDINFYLPKFDIDDTFPFWITGIISLLLILYNYMDTSFAKKEILLKVIHGDSSLYHYILKSIVDTTLFAIVFCVCFLFQTYFFPAIQFYRLILLIGIPFFIGIWLVNLQLLKIQPKEILYGHQFSKKLMSVLSIFNSAIAILSCVTILLLFQEIPSLGKFRKSKDFFTEHRDSVFLELRTDSNFRNKYDKDPQKLKEINRKMNEFWNKADTILEPICIKNQTSQMSDYDIDWQALYCNNRAFSYIRNVYPEANNSHFEKYNAVLLVPDDLSENEIDMAMNFFKLQFSSIEGFEISSDNIELIKFCSNKEIVALSRNGKSCFELCRKPVIFISANIPETIQKNNIYLADGSIFKSINDDKITELIDGLPVIAVKTNAYEQYQSEKKTHISLIVMTAYITIMILILYISVIHTILDLDYKVNAIELAIKKVHGWSILQKNKRHIINATVELIINLCLTVLMSYEFDLTQTILFTLIPISLYILTIGIICITVKIIEKKKLVKILKGGAL